MSDHRSVHPSARPAFGLFSGGGWAVAAAVVFILLIVAGVLSRIPS
jgi:hypothetical protein